MRNFIIGKEVYKQKLFYQDPDQDRRKTVF